jgi:DNA-binding NarL/FixJ family response regulator
MASLPDKPRPQRNAVGLTPRELDVVRLLAQALTDQEIADALYISLRTAETHVSRILGKLDVRSRTEAAILAVKTGLV